MNIRATFSGIVALILTCPLLAQSPSLNWVQQLGSEFDEFSYSVAVDGSGNSYISGYTTGSIATANAGRLDAFLAKYDASGNLAWTRQLGTSTVDESFGVSVDLAGNSYITGYTDGSLQGTNAGKEDVFLAKYDTFGNQVWITQFGTTDSEFGNSVATDSLGNVFIAGTSGGGFSKAKVWKYDNAGNFLWSNTYSGGYDRTFRGTSITVDNDDNAYFAGVEGGNPPVQSEAFVVKIGGDGSTAWKRDSFDVDRQDSVSVAADVTGNVYVAGGSSLAKYSPDSIPLWTKSIGGSPASVAIDALGNPHISGSKQGDAFVAKYDDVGDLVWEEFLGTDVDDKSKSIVFDDFNNFYITGETSGSLGGPNGGIDAGFSTYDGFIAKYSIPEPTSLALLGFGGLLLTRRRR